MGNLASQPWLWGKGVEWQETGGFWERGHRLPGEGVGTTDSNPAQELAQMTPGVQERGLGTQCQVPKGTICSWAVCVAT